MNKKQLEQFDEKFIYDYFDNTGLEIFGNRKENRPANDEEIKQFISTLLKAQRQEIIEEIEIKEKVIIQTLRNIDTDEDTIRDIIDVFTDLK